MEDATSAEPYNINMKQMKSNKYIIPLALVKLVLAFVVFQLFFTSCENDDIIYGSDLYTDGPLFEIQASLGSKNFAFESGGDANLLPLGDTVYLDILMESNTLFDEISMDDITLSNPQYHTQFAILDSEGEIVSPSVSFQIYGNIDDFSSGIFEASFGDISGDNIYTTSQDSSLARLRVGFVLDVEGVYTFHFINTPNNLTSEGGIDIYYDRDLTDSDVVQTAYAVYLFDKDYVSHDYGEGDDSYKSDVLVSAWADQAIIDFTVYALFDEK